jgi:hypothetical protein
MAEDYGYEVRREIQAKTFKFADTYPFSSLCDGYFVKCMVKSFEN